MSPVLGRLGPTGYFFSQIWSQMGACILKEGKVIGVAVSDAGPER